MWLPVIYCCFYYSMHCHQDKYRVKNCKINNILKIIKPKLNYLFLHYVLLKPVFFWFFSGFKLSLWYITLISYLFYQHKEFKLDNWLSIHQNILLQLIFNDLIHRFVKFWTNVVMSRPIILWTECYKLRKTLMTFEKKFNCAVKFCEYLVW